MKSNEKDLHDELKNSLRSHNYINLLLWGTVIVLLIAFNIRNEAGAADRAPVDKTAIQTAPAPVEAVKEVEPQHPVQPDSPRKNYGLPGGALWKFESGTWNGWIDIRTDGLYFTHWGWGHWTREKDGSFLLQNDHDSFSHRLRFDGNNQHLLKGERADGVWERCEMVFEYAKMPQPR